MREPPARRKPRADLALRCLLALGAARLASIAERRGATLAVRAGTWRGAAAGVLILGAPMVVGILLGTDALAGLLAGAITSSVQMAISQSNTGGAWDNAKKYVEKVSRVLSLL